MNIFFGSRHKRPVKFCIMMDVTEVEWLFIFCSVILGEFWHSVLREINSTNMC